MSCDHKFVDSRICLKCGWSPEHDNTDWPRTHRQPTECPKCDGVHDHQLDWVDERCSKCGGRKVAVMTPNKPLEEPGYGHGI